MSILISCKYTNTTRGKAIPTEVAKKQEKNTGEGTVQDINIYG